MSPITPKGNAPALQTYFLVGLLVIVVAIIYRIFRPYLTPLVFAGTLAVIFWPIHRRLKKFFGLPAFAAGLSLVIVLLGILLPLAAVTATALLQAQELLRWLSQQNQVKRYLEQLTAMPKAFLGDLAPTWTLDVATLDEYLRQLATFFIRHIRTVISGIAGTLIHLVVFLLALYYFLKDGEHLPAVLSRLSPLPDADDRKIMLRVKTMVTTVIQGTLLVALIKGVLTWIGFAVFGVPGAVLWGLVTVLAAIVPFAGVAITFVPAIAFLLINDHTGAALGLTIWGVLVVGLIDNFLNPKFIGGRAKINPLLVLLAVLGGLQVFGVIGFLVGPIVLSILIALLEIYQHEFKGTRPTTEANGS